VGDRKTMSPVLENDELRRLPPTVSSSSTSERLPPAAAALQNVTDEPR